MGMLPADIIINHVQQPGLGWVAWFAPLLAFVGALGVAGMAAWSLKGSDERKKAQEDRRRWDIELVDTVVETLVLTDDVADTGKALRKKKKAILAGSMPIELNRHLVKIRLLTNERLAELAQEVVIKFMMERMEIQKHLKAETDKGVPLDDIVEVPGFSFNSSSSENYSDARRQFMNAFHKLVVSVSVQKFTDIQSTNWKHLVKVAQEEEERLKREAEAAKHRQPNAPEPATAVRGWIP